MWRRCDFLKARRRPLFRCPRNLSVGANSFRTPSITPSLPFPCPTPVPPSHCPSSLLFLFISISFLLYPFLLFLLPPISLFLQPLYLLSLLLFFFLPFLPSPVPPSLSPSLCPFLCYLKSYFSPSSPLFISFTSFFLSPLLFFSLPHVPPLSVATFFSLSSFSCSSFSYSSFYLSLSPSVSLFLSLALSLPLLKSATVLPPLKPFCRGVIHLGYPLFDSPLHSPLLSLPLSISCPSLLLLPNGLLLLFLILLSLVFPFFYTTLLFVYVADIFFRTISLPSPLPFLSLPSFPVPLSPFPPSSVPKIGLLSLLSCPFLLSFLSLHLMFLPILSVYVCLSV